MTLKNNIAPCDIEIWQLTLKNTRVLFLCYFGLCALFRSHWWIKTGVKVLKRLVRVKNRRFLAVCPWNVTDDHKKTIGTSHKQQQTLCIIPSPYLNSNWSYSPEPVKLGVALCDLELWPLTLTFFMDLTSVRGNKSWIFHDMMMRT